MAKSYCLTIEVQSAHIEGGVGYMVAFMLPDKTQNPADYPEFADWSKEVRRAVIGTGDEAFNPDPYSRKLALANLMHELDDINRRYNIRIGYIDDVPAVQIHSTNPFDTQIEADFSDEEGNFHVIETNPAVAPSAHVHENGKTGIIEAGRKTFPFDKPPAACPKKPEAPPYLNKPKFPQP